MSSVIVTVVKIGDVPVLVFDGFVGVLVSMRQAHRSSRVQMRVMLVVVAVGVNVDNVLVQMTM